MQDESKRIRDERLRWQCRRALLELDILFARFWSGVGDQGLSDDDAEALNGLLALEDHALWALVADDSLSSPENPMLQRLRRL